MAQPLPATPPLTARAAEAPARHLDPFIFPHETRGRFRMLVIAALLVGLNLAQVVVEVTRGAADRARLTEIVEEYGGIVIIDPSNPDLKQLDELRRRYHTLSKACVGIIAERLLIPALVFASLAILAVGIYRRHPRRVWRRHRPQPLSAEQAPEVMGYLERCAGRLGVPRLRIEHRPGFGEGQAYGLRGSEALLPSDN